MMELTIRCYSFNFLIVMVVPIMITSIGWGTYLFFACTNACFIPIIYFFYPETAKRSLEEIDLIFAKGYLENMSYVKAAKELEFLDARGVEALRKKYDVMEAQSGGDVGEKGILEGSGAETPLGEGERTRVGSESSSKAEGVESERKTGV